MKLYAMTLAALIAVPQLAHAEDEAAGTFDIVGVKTCTAIDSKECSGETTTFTTGDKAWVWLKLKPADASATISMKWSWNDNPVWTMDPRPVLLGRTWYYKTFDQPGDWKVEILDNNGTSLHTATVTVTGEPVAKAAAAPAAVAPAAAAPAAAAGEAPGAVADSSHVAVVELKLAGEIKDRQPVAPSTNFAIGAKVYTWAKLDVKDAETSVKFKWFKGDALIYTSDAVTVKQSPSWRTWLYKTVDAAGDWKVQVVDSDDKAVHELAFSVQ